MSQSTQNAFAILANLGAKANPQPVADSTQKPPKVSRVKTMTDEFNDIIRDGIKRTGFKKERIDAFLPPNLLQLYQAVNRPAGKLQDEDSGKVLLDFIRDGIFGILPDYTSLATPSQSEGFKINGKPVAILMRKEVAIRQLGSVRDGMGNDFIKRCQINLKERFPPVDVQDAILGTGYGKYNRQLVANIVRIAEEMKSIPK